MFGLAKRLVLEDGQFVEQIREVEAFVGLNPVHTLLQPVDVQGTDGRRVVARCYSGPGMGPDVNGPTSTVVMPPRSTSSCVA